MTEGELQALVQSDLEAAGWLTHHCRDSRACDGQPGFPDLVAVRDGQLLVAELKSEHGRWSLEQLRWRRQLGEAGLEVREIRPGSWPGKPGL